MKISLILMAAALTANAQSIRVIRFDDSKPFTMGNVTSRRVVHPGLGAKRTTLNFSASGNGDEFAQHTHDESDDTIVVLQGKMDLRQGDSRTPYTAGQCAFVPGGQIHGTITTAPDTIMISFQTPPDFKLYTGERDSSKTGAAPKGIITPGAVKKIDCLSQDGFFTNPGMGSKRAAGGHWKLKAKQSFRTEVAAAGEQVIFVWKGAIEVKDAAGKLYQAGERDAVYVTGPARFSVKGGSAGAEIVQIQAPPSKNQ